MNCDTDTLTLHVHIILYGLGHVRMAKSMQRVC